MYEHPGTSLVVQWLRLLLRREGVWVLSLVRKLGFPHALRPQNLNTKGEQYYNKVNKDHLKMVHIKKKNLKKKERKEISC